MSLVYLKLECPVRPFNYACRGGASRQATDQWQQLYVLTSQITGVTNTSLDSATGLEV